MTGAEWIRRKVVVNEIIEVGREVRERAMLVQFRIWTQGGTNALFCGEPQSWASQSFWEAP